MAYAWGCSFFFTTEEKEPHPLPLFLSSPFPLHSLHYEQYFTTKRLKTFFFFNHTRCSLSWKCRTLLSESEGVRQSDPLSPTVGLRGPTVGLTVGPLSPTAGPWGPTGTPRCPGAQVPRYPGTQVPRYPGTQVQVQEQVPRNRKKVVKEQPQLHMTNTKVSSHVGHSCTEEIMIQQFTRKIT